MAALRATAQRRWNVPGSPVEAPPSHLVIHAQDVLLPLGVEHRAAPRAATLVLDRLLAPRAEGLRKPGLFDGLTLVASDVDRRHGEGDEVRGPAAALLTTLAGRTGAMEALSGPAPTTSAPAPRLERRSRAPGRDPISGSDPAPVITPRPTTRGQPGSRAR